MEKISPYREAEAKFGDDIEGLREYCRQHRLDDITLCLGYWLLYAESELNMNNSAVTAAIGNSRGFLSQVLGGRTTAAQQTYAKIARLVGANPLEFLIAQGLVDVGDIAAYNLPHANDLVLVARKFEQVPPTERPKVAALIVSVIDAVLSARDTMPATKKAKASSQ